MKHLASASHSGEILVFNFKPQLRAFRYAKHKGPVLDVTWSPTGELLASAGKDGTVRLFLPTVKGESSQIKAHTGAVRSVCFDSTGQFLASCGNDKTTKVWDIESQRFKFSLINQKNWLRTTTFSPDDRLIASGSDDKTVCVFDIRSRKAVHKFYDCTANVNCVKFTPDGTAVAAADNGGSINLWDLRSSSLLQAYRNKDPVNSIDFDSSGSYLLSGVGQEVKIYDLLEGHLYFTLYGHSGTVLSTKFSRDSDWFSSAGTDCNVLVWKTNFINHNSQGEEFVSSSSSSSKRGGKKGKKKGSPRKRPQTAPSSDRMGNFDNVFPKQSESNVNLSSSFYNNNSMASPKQPKFKSRGGGNMSNDSLINMQQPQYRSPGGIPSVKEQMEDEEYAKPLLNELSEMRQAVDVLTQTIAVLEERLRMSELKNKQMEENQMKLLMLQQTGTSGTSGTANFRPSTTTTTSQAQNVSGSSNFNISGGAQGHSLPRQSSNMNMIPSEAQIALENLDNEEELFSNAQQ
eukprot:TRINITY_DN3094_c0_g2_i1.p1 TRINITY_DN3094_c0_g2~~TRINITY_DN3094_c0_g2_i1.p1  ORF type:complete len:516 (+),score=167.38 TRINITY_DN3094_c0_g2_i1:509-2056(+)